MEATQQEWDAFQTWAGEQIEQVRVAAARLNEDLAFVFVSRLGDMIADVETNRPHIKPSVAVHYISAVFKAWLASAPPKETT